MGACVRVCVSKGTFYIYIYINIYIYILYLYLYLYFIFPKDICIKSWGLSSRNRSILYNGFPLWLGSESCDSIQFGGLCFILRLAWYIWCWRF